MAPSTAIVTAIFENCPILGLAPSTTQRQVTCNHKWQSFRATLAEPGMTGNATRATCHDNRRPAALRGAERGLATSACTGIMPAPMPVIATISVAEAGAALGLRPPSVRRLIASRELAAVLIGGRWLVGLASVNALLAEAERPSRAVDAVVAEPRRSQQVPAENDAWTAMSRSSASARAAISTGDRDNSSPTPASSSAAPSTISLVQNDDRNTCIAVANTAESGLPNPIPAQFRPDDRPWIDRYQRELGSADPEVRRQAAWQLERFAAAAEEAARRPRFLSMSPTDCQAMAQAILASSPSGSGW
jgi:hypothetical protein